LMDVVVFGDMNVVVIDIVVLLILLLL